MRGNYFLYYIEYPELPPLFLITGVANSGTPLFLHELGNLIRVMEHISMFVCCCFMS